MKQMKRFLGAGNCWILHESSSFVGALIQWCNFVHSFVDPPMLHPKYRNWGQDVHPRSFFDFLHRTHRQRDSRDSIYTYLYSISILIFTWAQWAQWALTCVQFQWLLIPCQGLAEKLKPPKTGKNKNKKKRFSTFFFSNSLSLLPRP